MHGCSCGQSHLARPNVSLPHSSLNRTGRGRPQPLRSDLPILFTSSRDPRRGTLASFHCTTAVVGVVGNLCANRWRVAFLPYRHSHMEVRPWSPSRPAALDLSKAPSFVLGSLIVDPPVRVVRCGHRSETLEPRVMRVLVALGGRAGQVLSRDDLIELCWDGQIVGENAINRVISRLRAVLSQLADDSVRLETITKVGFRLVSDTAPAENEADALLSSPPAPSALWVHRRWLLVGGSAAVVSVATGALWQYFSARRPNPEAVRLLERGNAVMRSARLGSTPEAIKLYGQAVRADPEYADAWGALSSSYRHALEGYGKGERRSYPQMVQSAADRALALDPARPDALIAKASIYPEFRNWLTQEKDMRALVRRFPDHWYANARMGILLRQVGRFEDGVTFAAKVLQIDVQLAPAWAGLINTYTLAGRFHEADAAFDDAMGKISPHPAIWLAKFTSLLESGRYGEAAAFALDPRTMPEEFPSQIGAAHGKLATALADEDRAGISGAIRYVKSTSATPATFRAPHRYWHCSVTRTLRLRLSGLTCLAVRSWVVTIPHLAHSIPVIPKRYSVFRLRKSVKMHASPVFFSAADWRNTGSDRAASPTFAKADYPPRKERRAGLPLPFPPNLKTRPQPRHERRCSCHPRN